MSPVREEAFGLALLATTLGAVLSRVVLASARRSGVYRSLSPGRTLVSSMHSDAFFLVTQTWAGRARLFSIGAISIAISWSIMEAIGW